MKRTFTQDERNIVFDLWKQGAAFSDVGRVIDATTDNERTGTGCIVNGGMASQPSERRHGALGSSTQ